MLGLTACATTRYVGDDEFLLSSVKIISDSLSNEPSINVKSMQTYLGQKPNKEVLGFIPWHLALYNMSNIKSNSWFNRLLRRWGEEPIIYNKEEAEYTANRLSTVLYNKGFLHAKTTIKLDTLAPKKIGVRYYLDAGDLYEISQHREFVKNKCIDSILHPIDTLQNQKLYSNERYGSYLRAGTPLSSDNMQKERHRITQILRNRGYYDFKDEDIYFKVDTTSTIKDVWVHTILDSTYQQYRIGKISIWQDIKANTNALHSENFNNIFFYRNNKHWLRPNVLNKRILFRKGDLYSSEQKARTYSALMNLKINSSVLIRYHIDSTALEPTLNCDIMTTMKPNKEFMLELIGTHSSGNIGVNTTFGFKHNNVFHGSEELSLLFRLGYEDLDKTSKNRLSYGFETSLKIPRVILPVLYNAQYIRTKATTDIGFLYDYQVRPEFNRKLFSLNWGYSWTAFKQSRIKHKLKLAEIDYMKFDYINSEFYKAMPDITRMLYYRNQFVLGSSYTFKYSSMAGNSNRYAKSIHNLRLHFQSAGNLLRGVSRLLDSKKDRYGAYSLMNINYAQFIRGELDYSALFHIDKKRALATHFASHIVYPYGNSRILPIDLRYFSGGANGMRGWGVRSLGPGSMSKKGRDNIFFQSGDIKLEMSLEYRKRLDSSFEFATFLDAGNIWTIYPYKDQKNGNFSFDRFYKEIALSTGWGLRWDFTYFLLRLDAGMKIYDPQEPMKKRWVFLDKSLKDLFAIHFALGYPF